MHYRIYYLDAARRLRRACDFHSFSDLDAKSRLHQADTVGFAAELWERGRLVACLPQKGCERCPHDPAHCTAGGAHCL
jgi:hypothetical protein